MMYYFILLKSYLIQHILGCLLHYSNRDIQILSKNEFYQIKEKILKKHGSKTGIDIQHIKNECWTCNGSGIFKCDWKLPEECFNCVKGIYNEYWARLQKYQLGKHSFHIPIRKMYNYNSIIIKKSLPVIEGYITHKTPKHRIGRECSLWLYLLFDRKLFFKELKRVGCRNNKRTPLVIIGSLIFRLKTFKKYYGIFWN